MQVPEACNTSLHVCKVCKREGFEGDFRVLVLGGVYGMIWNIEDCLYACSGLNYSDLYVLDDAPKSCTPATEWEGKLEDILWSCDDNEPRFRHEKWKQVFDKQLGSTPLAIQAADPVFL